MKKQIIYNLYFFIFILSCSSVFSLSQDSPLNQDELNNITDTTTQQYKFSKEIYNQSIPETIKVNTTIIMMNNNHSSLSNLTYTIKNATVNKIEETNIQLLSIIIKKDNNKEEENNNNQTKLYTVKLDSNSDFIKISENIKINTTITTSITNTADKNLTYSIKNGNDAGIFTIDNKTGIIKISASPDFEAKRNHFIIISGDDDDDDDDDDRYHVNITLYVKIGDVNEAPVFNDVTPLILNTKDVENINVNDMAAIRNGTYCFRKIIAHDPDIINENDEQHIVYEINGTKIDDIIGIKNSKKCFNNANYYDNYFWNLHDGCLKLKNPFFEKCAFYVLEFLTLGQPADYYISSDVIVNAIDNNAIGDYKNTTLILETKITWKFLCHVYGCPPNDIDVEKKTWFQRIIDMFSSIY